MTQELFMEKLLDILDCEQEITLDTLLSDVEEWDSLSFVSFLAMVNVTSGKKIDPAKVRDAKYVKDLFNLIIK